MDVFLLLVFLYLSIAARRSFSASIFLAPARSQPCNPLCLPWLSHSIISKMNPGLTVQPCQCSNPPNSATTNQKMPPQVNSEGFPSVRGALMRFALRQKKVIPLLHVLSPTFDNEYFAFAFLIPFAKGIALRMESSSWNNWMRVIATPTARKA